MNERQLEKYDNVPKIRFETAFNNLEVKTISFERNGLYLNDTLYNAGGISGYSRVQDEDRILPLSDIEPPFILRKKGNNDTLEIFKGTQRFFLNVTEEINWSRKK